MLRKWNLLYSFISVFNLNNMWCWRLFLPPSGKIWYFVLEPVTTTLDWLQLSFFCQSWKCSLSGSFISILNISLKCFEEDLCNKMEGEIVKRNNFAVPDDIFFYLAKHHLSEKDCLALALSGSISKRFAALHGANK